MNYDLITIGGGSAGLTAATIGARAGLKVALVEKGRLGGDCTWTGCVPSKALIHVAKRLHAARQAQKYTRDSTVGVVDMGMVRAHLDEARHTLYQPESPEALRQQGIDVIKGAACFLDPHMISVNGQTLQAKKFILAMGARPIEPNISGLEGVRYFTSETFFEHDQLPERLAIIGAGYIGVEMGQAYQRLGAQVTVIGADFLKNVDPDARDVIKCVLESEGVHHIAANASAVRRDDDRILITAGEHEIEADQLLVAVGRKPTVDGLDLDKAGVTYAAEGIQVNAKLQTSAKHIYAVGDCTGGFQETHYAGYQGGIAATNALLPFFQQQGVRDHIVYTIFTSPEIAQVGLTEAQAREQHGSRVRVMTMPMHDADRAVTESDLEGFIKLIYLPRGKILGATIVADRAGEAIMEYALAIERGISALTLAGVIHPYPTYTSASYRLFSEVLSETLLEGWIGRIVKGFVRLTYR